jgi:hypothetical protein
MKYFGSNEEVLKFVKLVLIEIAKVCWLELGS